jgi:GxxExxY protein
MADIPNQDVTYKIIGAAMHVHNELGPGLKEAIYQRALSVAMRDAGLGFEEEYPFRVEFDGEFAGLLYLDHFVENQVVVEIKALRHMLTNDELGQIITYMAVTESRVGLLLNFGRQRLEYKRVLPPKKFEDWKGRVNRYLWRPPEESTRDEANPFIRSESVVHHGVRS